MSEENGMYNELDKWRDLINRLQVLAIEMMSQEQDVNFINSEIESLSDTEPEDDYTLTFHDHRSPKKLKFYMSWAQVDFDEVET